MEHLSHCRVCSHPGLERLPGLGRLPAFVGRWPAGEIVPNPAAIHRVICTSCGTLQTDRVPLPLRLLSDALDFDGVTEHGRREAERLAARFPLSGGELVIDVGANDGTLLRTFQARGARVLGIEPSVPRTARALRDGVPTILGQFSPILGRYLERRLPRARLVVSRFQLGVHRDVPAFLKSLATILDADGIAVLQVRHVLGVNRELGGEMVHPVNPCAFSVSGLAKLAPQCGLTLADAEEVPPHSASIVLTLRPEFGAAVSDRVKQRIDSERSAAFHEPNAWDDFSRRWFECCALLHDAVARLARQKLRVAGYAASPEAVALIHAAGLGPDLLGVVLDPNEAAHGRWTAAGPLPIVDAARGTYHPDVLVVLDRSLQAEAVTWALQHPPTRVLLPFPHPHEVRIHGPMPKAA